MVYSGTLHKSTHIEAQPVLIIDITVFYVFGWFVFKNIIKSSKVVACLLPYLELIKSLKRIKFLVQPSTNLHHTWGDGGQIFING